MVGIIAGCEGNEPKASGPYNRRRKNWKPTMTTEQKVIKAKVGLLELAKQLGSVSQACTSRDGGAVASCLHHGFPLSGFVD